MGAMRDHAIRVLNELIGITLASAHGYEEAAQRVANRRLKAVFDARAVERRRLRADLQRAIRDLGGAPPEEMAALAALMRGVLAGKTVRVHGDQAIIEEIEAGENYIRNKFHHAAADPHLPSAVKRAVRESYDTVTIGVARPSP